MNIFIAFYIVVALGLSLSFVNFADSPSLSDRRECQGQMIAFVGIITSAMFVL